MQKRRSGGYIQDVVVETARKTSKGGWLTGGNLAGEETQEQERKKHARSFKDASAARLMHTQMEKHTR